MYSDIFIVKFYLGTDACSEYCGILLEENGSKKTLMQFLKHDYICNYWSQDF